MVWVSPAVSATSTNRENGTGFLALPETAHQPPRIRTEASAAGTVCNRRRRVQVQGAGIREIIAASVASGISRKGACSELPFLQRHRYTSLAESVVAELPGY